MKLIAKLITAVGLAVGIAGGVQANVVTNGSFETGDFTGWTQAGNTSFNGVTCPGGAPDGNCFGFFGPVGTPSTLSQTLGLLTGRFYTITFAWAGDSSTPGSLAFSASLGGTTFFTAVDVNTNGFRTVTRSILATAPNESLSFSFRDDPGFIFLDAVTANVPEPASLALLGIALSGMGFARRRKKA